MTQLMLPVFLHGTTQDVRKAARRAASRVAQGESFAELAEELLDAAAMPGLILSNEERRWPDAHLPHFQGYLFLVALHREYKTFKDPRWDPFVEDMARLPWLICCALGQDSYMLFEPPERARRFVTAIRDHGRRSIVPERSTSMIALIVCGGRRPRSATPSDDSARHVKSSLSKLSIRNTATARGRR
jgi:hypothetical protein